MAFEESGYTVWVTVVFVLAASVNIFGMLAASKVKYRFLLLFVFRTIYLCFKSSSSRYCVFGYAVD